MRAHSDQYHHFAPRYGKLGAEFSAWVANAPNWSHACSGSGEIMRHSIIASICFVTALATGTTQAQEAPATLFGITIGSQFTPSRDYVFVQENTGTLYYSLRKVTNQDYLLQGVAVSAGSHVVVKVDGRTASGSEAACQRMLFETRTQLKARYPKLKERVDDVAGTAWHLLSFDRPGCFFNVTVGGTSLRVPCSSSFMLHCERLSNAFVIEASDTEYSKRARDEAQTIARSPKRNHLD